MIRIVLNLVILMIFLAFSGCAYIVVDCVGTTGGCGTVSSSMNTTTPVQVTVPVSALPGLP